MDIASAIINLRLSPKGGVYRSLPLLTESCVAEGYGKIIRRITSFTYGASGAVGNARGLHTLYDIDTVVRKMSAVLKKDGGWLARTRNRALRVCREFEKKLHTYASEAKTDPKRFLMFVIREYPSYMAGIGSYNLCWRYLEFASSDLTKFPHVNMRKLSQERNVIAKIYPPCEYAMKLAARAFCRPFGMHHQLLLMMTRDELKHTITTSRFAVSKKMLQKRAREYVYLYLNGKEYVETNAQKLNTINKYLRSLRPSTNRGTFYGTSVSSGRATGTVVRRIRRPSWPRNPIFVTPMTHPSDVPYLKRIKGLVTDEGGGILSHAAIVARELKIPCITATRVATKVFREGDKIVVDTQKGFVKRV